MKEGAWDSDILLRDELVRAAVHDLRSPVGAIAIFVELLKGNGDNLTQQQSENIAMIADAGRKLQDILDDIHEISTICRGTVGLNLAETDFRKAVDMSLERLRPRFERGGLRVAAEFNADLTRVMSDEKRLGRILDRVFEDGVLFAASGSEIRVSDANAEGAYIFSALIPESGRKANAKPAKNDPFSSLTGKVGRREPGESAYSQLLCARLMALMGGTYGAGTGDGFAVKIELPLIANAS